MAPPFCGWNQDNSPMPALNHTHRNPVFLSITEIHQPAIQTFNDAEAPIILQGTYFPCFCGVFLFRLHRSKIDAAERRLQTLQSEIGLVCLAIRQIWRISNSSEQREKARIQRSGLKFAPSRITCAKNTNDRTT